MRSMNQMDTFIHMTMIPLEVQLLMKEQVTIRKLGLIS
jgi:hypothetical protein